jgi:hypothetical protein
MAVDDGELPLWLSMTSAMPWKRTLAGRGARRRHGRAAALAVAGERRDRALGVDTADRAGLPIGDEEAARREPGHIRRQQVRAACLHSVGGGATSERAGEPPDATIRQLPDARLAGDERCASDSRSIRSARSSPGRRSGIGRASMRPAGSITTTAREPSTASRSPAGA